MASLVVPVSIKASWARFQAGSVHQLGVSCVWCQKFDKAGKTSSTNNSGIAGIASSLANNCWGNGGFSCVSGVCDVSLDCGVYSSVNSG